MKRSRCRSPSVRPRTRSLTPHARRTCVPSPSSPATTIRCTSTPTSRREPNSGALVVQGGLTTGLLHTLVAMDMPGPGTVFLSQNWKFTAPRVHRRHDHRAGGGVERSRQQAGDAATHSRHTPDGRDRARGRGVVLHLHRQPVGVRVRGQSKGSEYGVRVCNFFRSSLL